MKTTLILLVFQILFFYSLFSQKRIVPPGTVKLNDSTYIDKFEVTNLNYREYMYWTAKKYGPKSPEFISILPDTTVWGTKTRLAYVSLYLRHPAYANYPVVGVTYEQAVKYCEWRTDRVNEYIYFKENKIKPGTDISNVQIPKRIKFRLPSRKEWEESAAYDFPRKIRKQLLKEKIALYEVYKFNFGDDYIKAPVESEITVPVHSYSPNIIGIYHILGNVAEMIDEYGIAKGGSWRQRPEEVTVLTDFRYYKPESWIGFRCVCDIIKEKNEDESEEK